MLTRRRQNYKNMHDIVNLAKKYSPKLVKGYSTGNISVVDKKSWLEVCDHKHRYGHCVYSFHLSNTFFRYGANLRAYYKEWKRIAETQMECANFWEWLDNDAVEVEGVPRTKLESETVLYCNTAAERKQFTLSINQGIIYHDVSEQKVDTGDEGWIFVLRDGMLYGGQKVTKQIPRIHHTSFVGGECVQTAGMMVIVDGRIQIIYPHSGHYRPSEHEVLILLRFLKDKGVDLSNIRVDVQRIQKVYRQCLHNGELVRKIDNAHFWNANRVLHFLELKQLTSKLHLFDELRVRVAKKWKKEGPKTRYF